MAKAGDEQLRAMIDNLPARTGRSLDEWLLFLRGREGEKHGALVAALAAEGVGHGYANLIVHTFRRGAVPAAAPSSGAEADELIARQYAGKETLEPIRDAILDEVRGFGDDVEVSPKKAYLSLRRSTQFALVQPSTKTRLDLGLKLRDTPAHGRLEDAGSWNSMVTHRVRLETEEQVDGEVRGWLRKAYEQA